MSPITGKLVTETLEYDGGRPVTTYVPPSPAEAIVFVADGAWHINRLSEVLEDTGAPPTMIVGVHGLPDDNGRLREYVPDFDSERFAAHEEFFVHQVSRWVASLFGVVMPADRTAVWGASLGGELALALGLRHPDIFGTVLAASPGAGYQPPAVLPKPLPRVHLVAGRQEPFFLDNAGRWADALSNAGGEVVFTQHDGQHGGAFWGDEFAPMVAWAFGH